MNTEMIAPPYSISEYTRFHHISSMLLWVLLQKKDNVKHKRQCNSLVTVIKVLRGTGYGQIVSPHFVHAPLGSVTKKGQCETQEAV